MKKIYIFLLFTIIAFSQTIFANTKYYRLSYRDDPSTTVVIGWSDDILSTGAMVYYGTTDFGTNWSSYPMSHGVDRSNSYVLLTNNFAELTGLTPNTKYYFVIKDDEGTSVTASAKAAEGAGTDPGGAVVAADDLRRANGRALG